MIRRIPVIVLLGVLFPAVLAACVEPVGTSIAYDPTVYQEVSGTPEPADTPKPPPTLIAVLPSPTLPLQPTFTPESPVRVTDLRLLAQPSGVEDVGVADADRLRAVNILTDHNTYQVMIKIRLSKPAGERIPLKLYAYNGGSPTHRPPVLDFNAVLVRELYWSEFSDDGNTQIIGARGTSVWYLEVLDPTSRSVLWSSYIRIIKP